jgi:asparagine synthase (glutamine-hydrolysing)
MCGITGFYSFLPGASRSALHVIGKNMVASLAHRGPDHEALWQDPDTPLLLAHRRLSIIDLSTDGNQPMSSASGRYVIVYNGEIYNYRDLQKEMENTGTVFRGRSDTEVFLAAVERWGVNLALQKINGMFAFALWDRRERRLHLVRDRLGKKPLYVGWAGKALVFASELKALRDHPDFVPAMNNSALSLYMRYGFVSAPHSIYQNVWSLPAGFRLTLEIEKLQPGKALADLMEPYWHHLRTLEEARVKTEHKKESHVIEEFENLLTTCVQDRLLSDVPLGAFLSGGIDSSAVVAIMQKSSSMPVKTYTVGFSEQGFDEAAHARKIAAHLGTDHHETILSAQDALDIVPKLAEIYDEPFADISAIPTCLVSRFARRDVTVALSGDGGDEMLGGYTRHFTGPKIRARMRLVPKPLRHMMGAAIHNISPARWNALKQSHPQFGAHMHKLSSILSLDSEDDIYKRLLTRWPVPPLTQDSPAFLLSDMSDWKASGLSFSENMMYWDALNYLPNDILVKVDRASMAASLETRAPLLDRRIYEYVWQLPVRYKIRGRNGKWLLREVLKRHVPPALFERPKQGFNMPVDAWLRGPLRDWAQDLLGEYRLDEQPYLDGEAIRKTWHAHLAGHGNHGDALWTVLMFQAWKRHWL